MRRRTLLSTAASTAGAGLAGCAGLVGTDPARLRAESLSVEGPVPVGSNATATLTVTNEGGSEGRLTGTVRPEWSDDGSRVTETVPAGETVSVEVDIGRAPAAGEYAVRFAGAPAGRTRTAGTEGTGTSAAPVRASTSLTVATADLAAGESATLGDLSVTVDSLSFVTGVFTGDNQYAPTGVFTADEDEALLRCDLTVANDGSENATWRPSSRLDLTAGQFYRGPEAPTVTDAGTHFGEEQSLAAGETASGYLLARVGRETAADGVALEAQVDGASTPPEYRWTTASYGSDTLLHFFSDITLESVVAPSSVPSGEPYEMTFTFRNAGGAGTVRGVPQLTYARSDATEWFKLADASPPVVETEVDADERRTVTVTDTVEDAAGQAFRFRLLPFDETWTISFT